MMIHTDRTAGSSRLPDRAAVAESAEMSTILHAMVAAMVVKPALAASRITQADALVDSELGTACLSVGDEDDVDVPYGLAGFFAEAPSLPHCFVDVDFVVDESEAVEDPADHPVGLEDGHSDISEKMIRGDAFGTVSRAPS
jgi:hypothetical protein